MREADYINELWSIGGPFVGEDGKPHTRVTIQQPWTGDPAVKVGDEDHVIHPAWDGVGTYKTRGSPIRWFQKEDNSQDEQELPNVKVVNIDRSIETDAGTCKITIYNQWMYDNGAVPEDLTDQGNRALTGYFTPTRGQSPESQVRWGHGTNEWEDVLVPNAIVRTYQGYGGHSKTISEAVEDGNLILSGVWLIDEVTISTDGMLNINCRDMAKLLIEQQLFPPLVPSSKYPLTYYRWVYESFAIQAAAKAVTSSSTVSVKSGIKRCIYDDSEVDRWYGDNTRLNGHAGIDSLDGNTQTYYLSVGNSGPDRDFSTVWIQYACGEYMNSIYVHPWAGNYEMYVSVYENGAWQGTSTVPYDESELYGNQPTVVDTGADIPYVQKFGVPWEKGQWYQLPRFYKADYVRISFRHLAYSGIGPWYYRGGVREFKIRASTSTTVKTASSTQVIAPHFWAGDSLRNPDNLNANGYITSSQFGQIDAFGDCRTYAVSGGNSATNAPVYWIHLTRTGDGYWVMRGDGSVTAYGAATYYGSPWSDGIGETGGTGPAGNRWQLIAPTPTDEGYWCVAVDGRIRAYGDATDYGATIPGFVYTTSTYIAGGSSLKESQGLLVASTDGTVYDFGDATHYGNWTAGGSEYLVTVMPTIAGDGYWLMKQGGAIQAKGAAVHYGQASPTTLESPSLAYDQLMPTPSDEGYYILRRTGELYAFGDAFDFYFGAPIPGSTGTIRKDGNYLDYADIVKDLVLWSGFWLYDSLSPSAVPDVFGNIESTGSFSSLPLPDEMFDKRPVIDALTQLKEAVGYLVFIDDEGGFRFESPNFWSFGNTIQSTGQRIYEIPEIDESVNMYDYSVSRNDDSLRSLIIISSEDPNEAGDSTVTTKVVPQTAQGLRGLLKPAMWVNGWFQDEEEQAIMAELIALHIWFAQRVGQVTCQANPAIQINDQVRLYERQTDEVNIHYVRGVNTIHDLDTGEYKMTLTTHWLGSGQDWVITDNEDYVEEEAFFVISQPLKTYLDNQGTQTDFLIGFPNEDPAFKGVDPLGPDGDPDPGSAT
jgi:hypothetical protein